MSRKNKNQWIELKDCYKLSIQYKHQFIAAYIDKADYLRASSRTWRIAKKKRKFYVVSGNFYDGTFIYLHKFVINVEVPEGYEIDHYNGNSLDNRKSNLRIVSRLENIQNSSVRSDSQIGIRGVSAIHSSHSGYPDRYKADIIFNKIRFFFRDWKSIEEAVYCRLCAERYFNLTILERNKLLERYDTLSDKRKREIEEYVHFIINRTLESNESNGS